MSSTLTWIPYWILASSLWHDNLKIFKVQPLFDWLIDLPSLCLQLMNLTERRRSCTVAPSFQSRVCCQSEMQSCRRQAGTSPTTGVLSSWCARWAATPARHRTCWVRGTVHTLSLCRPSASWTDARWPSSHPHTCRHVPLTSSTRNLRTVLVSGPSRDTLAYNICYNNYE